MSYLVPPGLYAVGNPTADSPVLVTANYKMSYDVVRRELSGRNVWLLILETFGINVWCAAGKGSFGTEEVVKRVRQTGLAKVVAHRRLLLPILGAPGVAAHEVARQTGFEVKYAALRAADIPEYLDNGMVTTPKMRELTFSFYERLVLIPVEVVSAVKTLAVAGAVIYIAALLVGGEGPALVALLAWLGAAVTGIVAGPALLPWLPGRSFAVKGAIVGLLFALGFYLGAGSDWKWPVSMGTFLAIPAVSAFFTLNFTGCSTYTSRSGVKKEMRLGLPLMGGALAVSLLLFVVGRFI